jgi:putative inorganic carbon (hco3(-)) transporter
LATIIRLTSLQSGTGVIKPESETDADQLGPRAADGALGPSLHGATRSVGIEWLLLVALVPLFWFPLRAPVATGLGLLCIPVLWLARVRRRDFTVRAGMGVPLIAILLAACAATVPMFDPGLLLPKLLGLVLGVAVLVLIASTLRTPVHLSVGMTVLGLLTLGVSVFGLMAADLETGKAPLAQPVLARVPTAFSALVPNSSGNGVNPNELAGDLALLVPVAGAYAFARRGRRSLGWGLSIAAAAVGTLVLLATQSRGGIAGLIVALLAGAGIALLERPARRGRRLFLAGYWALVAVAGLGAWRVTAAWVTATSSTSTSTNLDSFTARTEIWRQALSMLRDFPLTGIGIGQFNPVLHFFYPTALIGSTEFVPHAHDLYLAYAVELGVPGALAFVALLISFFCACSRAIGHTDPTVAWTARGLALGVVAFLVFGIFDAIAPGARGGLILWAILGFGFATDQICSRAHEPAMRVKTSS